MKRSEMKQEKRRECAHGPGGSTGVKKPGEGPARQSFPTERALETLV